MQLGQGLILIQVYRPSHIAVVYHSRKSWFELAKIFRHPGKVTLESKQIKINSQKMSQL